MTDNQKIMALLRKDSLSDLVALIQDPCDGCECEGCGNYMGRIRPCGYYEQDGLMIGPAHARKELERRLEIIKLALKTD